MNVGMRVRGGMLAALIMLATPVAATLVASPAFAQAVSSIQVEGNRRVEIETIRSYFKPGPGGRLDQASIDDGLKALIETGLFQDVRISTSGGRLVVTVVENPVIGRVAFEGNKKIKDEQLSAEVQSKPRGTLSRPMVQADAQRIAEIYRRSGRYDVRVNPEIIEQPNNRADLIFTITEGSKTSVKSVEFIGNSAYSSYRLKDVIKTHEANLLSFLGGGDVYDPDRVEADRDLIRRYYLKHGFADVQVVAALTEYDPERRGFLVTFKIEEGQQYRVGSVEFQSSIATLDPNTLKSFSRVYVGSLYNAEALEKSVEEMQIEASRRGYAFAIVRPRGDRNFEQHTVSIVFSIDEGALAEVSISERNFLGRGLYAKASVTYGQYARGYTLSFVEPYLLDYRVALGLDFFQRQQLANNYIAYGTKTLGFSPRLGFALREDLSLQLRYSIYQQEIQLPGNLANCNNNPANGLLAFNPSPAFIAANGIADPTGTGLGCYSDGEASLPVRKELQAGKTLTSAVGYSLNYNTLDNNKNPTDGLLVDFKQDFAGVGGDVRYLKSAIDVKYYAPLVADIVGLIHIQSGILNSVGSDIRMLDHFQMGPNLVRGFAPNGIGPRDLNPFGTNDALGGTKYWGASAELQMPFWFLPKEVGLKGSVYADAGSLYDYKGPTSWTATNEVNVAGCIPSTRNPVSAGTCTGLIFDNGNVVRTSVGVGLIWASPFGPLRFDYAVPLTKGPNDRVQQFKFGGGTSF